MQTRRIAMIVTFVGALALFLAASSTVAAPQGRLIADNPNPPASTVKLIFIHHSTGGNWLADPNQDQPYGGLGMALMNNNYFVSATNYGWGLDNIGDRTDIPHWPEWFTGPNSNEILAALYNESGQNVCGDGMCFGNWSRLGTNPGGENEIILFKSCFPNSYLYGNPGDPPYAEPNDWEFSVSNAKAVYNKILTYFQTRQDKLFVVITAPPLMQSETAPERAANARAFNNWLMNDWLDGYPYKNVAVFDYYNVLTSNGGNVNTNDLGWTTGNHHRWWSGAVQHIQTVDNNYSAYPSGDSHPTTAGHQKATAEFVQLLNVFYNRWAGGAVTPTPTTGPPTTATPTATATGTRPPSTATSTPTPTATQPAGQQTMTFQDGVSPNASYAGTTDVILANDYDNVAPNANLGGLDHLETFFGEAEYRRSLVHWDISALPDDITISSATMELYRYDGNAENAMQIALYRVTRNWAEGTGWELQPDPGYVPDGATWTLASPGTAWTTPGGDYDTTIVGQITLPVGMGNGWVSLDATASVRAWIEGGMANYGLLLRPLNGDYTYHYYYSRNYGTPNLRPRLVVNYTVGGTVTPTPTASATPVSPDLPDLIVNSMKIELETGDSCDYTSTELGVRVWVENIGGGDANPFVVDVNGSQQDINSGLAAGQITSTWFADSYIWPGDNTAFADATFLIEESNEDNNQLTQFLPIPTLPPTCTPTSTPTSTSTPMPPLAYRIYLPLILKSWSPPTPTPTATPTTVIPSGLIQPTDLVYQGAFRLPGGDTPPQTFAYGGNAMTFNPDGDPANTDPYPGSLFVMGHDRMAYGDLPDGNQVAEVSIPVPAIADNPADLPQAAFIQGFYDVTAGYFTQLEEIPKVGMQYLNHPTTGPKIHLAWGQHLQPPDVPSHAWFNPTLETPDLQGVWFIGYQNLYSTNGYMFDIPTSWADAHAASRYLATGRMRDGGQGGMGPALFAYRPWLPDGSAPPSGTHLDETTLLLYENAYNTSDFVRCLDGYQHADEWEGGAWITTPSGKSAVLFAGTKSTGTKHWYGFINPLGPEYPCVDQHVTDFDTCRMANGSSCPVEDYAGCCDEEQETCVSYRGWWSTRFDAQFILYDPAQLAQVAAGEIESWEPQPYASLDIDEHLYLDPPAWDLMVLGWDVQRRYRIGAAAYDRENALLYVLELYADGGKPVVHVWRVEG